MPCHAMPCRAVLCCAVLGSNWWFDRIQWVMSLVHYVEVGVETGRDRR